MSRLADEQGQVQAVAMAAPIQSTLGLSGHEARAAVPVWQPRLRWAHLLPALLGLGSVALLMWAVRQVPDPEAIQSWGLLGVFVANLICSASIFLPVPGFAAVMAAGVLWPAPVVGIVSGFGSATGELTGYLAGRSGGALLGDEQNPWLRRLHRWLDRHGFLTIFLIAAAPLPLFDFAGLAAGASNYSVVKFWLACALGKAVKLTALALFGGLVAQILALLPQFAG